MGGQTIKTIEYVTKVPAYELATIRTGLLVRVT